MICELCCRTGISRERFVWCLYAGRIDPPAGVGGFKGLDSLLVSDFVPPKENWKQESLESK